MRRQKQQQQPLQPSCFASVTLNLCHLLLLFRWHHVLQLQHSCSSVDEELAAASTERDSLRQELRTCQDSLDAVAAELTATLARADAAEAAVAQLRQELQAAQQEQQAATQQVRAAQHHRKLE